MSNNDIESFRDGIFNLNTRRFGTVAEIMIQNLYNFDDSGDSSYDLFDSYGNSRIEVKFSRATKENGSRIQSRNIIEQCLYASQPDNRALNSNETHQFSFDSNIQQVKTRCFDYLYYGLFFKDRIEIFGISSNEVSLLPGYSDHQHLGNNGEGQFHLNNNSIDFHRQNCLQRILTYHELFQLLEN